MVSEQKPKAAASVEPVRAISCTRAEQRDAACAAEARAWAAAEVMSELKPKAAASIKPVRAISCTRAEQREAACAARA